MSCPARFNPRKGKWIPVTGVNPHKCPLNENFMRICWFYAAENSRQKIISQVNVNAGN